MSTPPAKPLQVWIARMRADADTVFERQGGGRGHHQRIAGMVAARDVGRADDAEHLGIAAHTPGAETSPRSALRLRRWLMRTSPSSGLRWCCLRRFRRHRSRPTTSRCKGPEDWAGRRRSWPPTPPIAPRVQPAPDARMARSTTAKRTRCPGCHCASRYRSALITVAILG